MKSLTIASFVSALYALWLSNYVAEGSTVVLNDCKLENLSPGVLDVKEMKINNGMIDNVAVDIKGQITSGLIMCDMRVIDENEETLFEQKKTDLCSLAANEYVKPIFEALTKSGMNSECPYDSGSFETGSMSIDSNGAPAGTYTLILEVFEGAELLSRATANLEIQE